MTGGGPLAGHGLMYLLAGGAAGGEGSEGAGILQHLLIDRAIKIGIVLVALIVLALGMALIWKRVGRAEPTRRDDR